MKKDTKRSRRKSPGGSKITSRDLCILTFIERFQPVATNHIQTRLSMSADMVRRRLRILRNHQLIHVHVPMMAGQNWYSLSRRGVRYLSKAKGLDSASLKSMRGIGRVRHLNHHSGVVMAGAALLAPKAGGQVVKIGYRLESEIRQALSTAHRVQLPDAVAIIEDDNGRQRAVAIEVDCKTESVDYIVETKGEPYAYFRENHESLLGTPDWSVGFIVPDLKRRNALIHSLWEVAPPEGLFFFTTQDQIRKDILESQNWVTSRLVGDVGQLVEQSPFEFSRL